MLGSLQGTLLASLELDEGKSVEPLALFCWMGMQRMFHVSEEIYANFRTRRQIMINHCLQKLSRLDLCFSQKTAVTSIYGHLANLVSFESHPQASGTVFEYTVYNTRHHKTTMEWLWLADRYPRSNYSDTWRQLFAVAMGWNRVIVTMWLRYFENLAGMIAIIQLRGFSWGGRNQGMVSYEPDRGLHKVTPASPQLVHGLFGRHPPWCWTDFLSQFSPISKAKSK